MNAIEFPAEDFALVAELIRRHANGDEAQLRAVMSNNLNVILAALDARSRPVACEELRKALEAGVRAAKLAIFAINKAGVMPNDSWKAGFDADLAVAEAALAGSPAKGKECPNCNGQGSEADYSGLEMRPVTVACSRCGGSGYLPAATPEPTADRGGNWRDDPSADERWSAGLDYGQTQLCAVLGVDPASISWDAATETLDGDVRSVIGNILTARFGDDWRASTADRGGEVSVKPLEWEQNWPDVDNALWANVPSINRTYTIDPTSNVFLVTTRLQLSEIGEEALGLHGTLEAAKAAAQADYEQRIRSALTPTDTPTHRVVEQPATRWRWKDRHTLYANAVSAVEALDDWTSVNEAEADEQWDGKEVNEMARCTFWRVKSGQALKALQELASAFALPTDKG